MAKIDPNKIDNWESLSVEDRLKAVLDYEIEPTKADESVELANVRKALDKASSECASYKKQLREKQTEAERAEADRLERENALQEQLKAYQTRERISTYKAQYMSIGYDAETAETLANATPEGMTEDFFATQKTFLENQRQRILTESINNQPSLSVGTPPTAAQAEKEEENILRKHMGLPLR